MNLVKTEFGLLDIDDKFCIRPDGEIYIKDSHDWVHDNAIVLNTNASAYFSVTDIVYLIANSQR